ncbi:MAG: OsmC family protein [Burkholderiales bacterium]|nr:OsmC family protein [Burkholderiales bacterium]
MNAEQLRALQAPLKEQYRATPDTAWITLLASGNVTGEGISCSVETGRALVQAGLHPATGGDGSFACSGDMLLQALAACAGVTLKAVATALGITLRQGEVLVEGDLDFRGTLGVDKAAPVGFANIRVRFILDTDADDAALASLLKLTERYCVVLQTLARGPQLDTRLERTNAVLAAG